MINPIMLSDIVDSNCKTYKYIIIGAGKIGYELFDALHSLGVDVVAFMDNDKSKHGKSYRNVSIQNLCKYEALDDAFDKDMSGYLYLIAINNRKAQRTIMNQLEGYGIDSDRIKICDRDLEYQYRKNLPEDRYRDEIDQLYANSFGVKMNWEHPTSYSEIINWEKIYGSDLELKRELTDKYLAREYVKKQIGETHLVRYLGVWDKPEQINFDALPNSFVIKLNNGSGRNIIVKDKSTIDVGIIIEELEYWMDRDYFFYKFESNYRGIKPRIICEEYLEGLAETVYDYDVFCFHGEPKYIWCISGSHREEAKASFYDLEWNRQDGVSYGYPYDPVLAPKPEQLDLIIEYSRKLSDGFRHCRVDWYLMPDGRVLFSEITFVSWGGLRHFIPEDWDKKFGLLITEKE
ncbi:TupA-like ATPgrasp [Lachnospiraceae bacterium XBB2008]|nr:TupA-like ATPgrasp [Lachnospiraceae bacterium XBB2008]